MVFLYFSCNFDVTYTTNFDNFLIFLFFSSLSPLLLNCFYVKANLETEGNVKSFFAACPDSQAEEINFGEIIGKLCPGPLLTFLTFFK